MVNNPPEYLHFKNHCNSSGVFNPLPFLSDEVIYRCYSGNKTHPINEFFSEVRFEGGISVNRSMYSKNPTDVLWRNEHIPSDDNILSCNYLPRNGIVIYSVYNKLIQANPPQNILLDIKNTWIKCNVSHCDIIINTEVEKITSPLKREVRLFLASLFKELSLAA